MDQPFELSAHVDTICLPTLDDRRDSYWGEGCAATGWGKDSFGNGIFLTVPTGSMLTVPFLIRL